MKNLALLVLVALTMVSCGKPDPEDIFKKEKSGVVVVLNKFYYEMQLPTGQSIYFTGFGEDGSLQNMTDDVNEIQQRPQMSFGTAFFVDKEGTLLTNRHVVAPPIDKEQVQSSFAGMLQAMRAMANGYMRQLYQRYQQLEAQKRQCYYYDDYGNLGVMQDKVAAIEQQQVQVQREFNKAHSIVQSTAQMSRASDLKLRVVSQLGIAYDGSQVSGENDFLMKNPTVVVKTSSDENIDLALIQLKSKKTPRDSYVFDVRRGRSGLKINSRLYMIGYNAGIVVANTRRGIKAQMTTGTVSQQPDGDRVLYSIPTVEGSSGSPVVNEDGELVAVNFAKLAVGHAENFNFGISLEQIDSFFKQR